MNVERIAKKDGAKIYYVLEDGKVARRILICKAKNLLNQNNLYRNMILILFAYKKQDVVKKYLRNFYKHHNINI